MSSADDIAVDTPVRPVAQHQGLIGRQPLPPEVIAKAQAKRREEGFPILWLITPATLWLASTWLQIFANFTMKMQKSSKVSKYRIQPNYQNMSGFC